MPRNTDHNVARPWVIEEIVALILPMITTIDLSVDWPRVVEMTVALMLPMLRPTDQNVAGPWVVEAGMLPLAVKEKHESTM